MSWNRKDYETYLARQARGSKFKPTIPNEPVAEAPGKNQNSTRYAVVVESRRTRLLDPDNLCGKFFIDALRYAGLIPGDSPKEITVEIRQEKVKRREEEETVITVEKLIHAN